MEETKNARTIAVAKGDGVGEEIMDSVLTIFCSAGVPLEYLTVPTDPSGELAYEAAEQTGILFKGPTAKSTSSDTGLSYADLSERWRLYANKTIFRSLPAVPDAPARPDMNLTLLQHRAPLIAGSSTDGAPAAPALPYAFEMASRKGRSSIIVALCSEASEQERAELRATLDQLEAQHPRINARARSIESIARDLVRAPNSFEVIVASAEHGRVLRGIGAGLVGGPEYVPSAHIGEKVSVFETAHGPAVSRAGQDAANPTALLLSGTMMLRQLGLVGYASVIEDALVPVLHQVFRKPDLGQPVPPFRTSHFTAGMCARLASIVDPRTLDQQTVAPEPPFESWVAA